MQDSFLLAFPQRGLNVDAVHGGLLNEVGGERLLQQAGVTEKSDGVVAALFDFSLGQLRQRFRNSVESPVLFSGERDG